MSAAFVAHGVPHSFGRSGVDAVRYVRSIYTDVLILASLQRYQLRDIVNELADLTDPEVGRQALLQVERQFARFRNDLWWQHVTQHAVRIRSSDASRISIA